MMQTSGGMPVRVPNFERHAVELARLADALLVNNRRVRGGYYRGSGGIITPTTRPGAEHRHRDTLTPAILERHFAARRCEDLVGLHSGSPAPASLARWIAIDIDKHSDNDDPERNVNAAIHWHDVLCGLGMRPWLVASNGDGGYHLWDIFGKPVPLAEAYRYARWLIRDWSDWLEAEPEAFPKQAELAPWGQAGSIGNWLRLPGRHKSRDYCSAVWDGERWRYGPDAASWLLGTSGDDPRLIARAAGNWNPERTEGRRPNPFCRPAPATDPAGSRYGFGALKRIAQEVVSAPLHTRNVALNRGAFALGQLVAAGHLDPCGAAEVLHAAAIAAGLTESETVRTIRSGIIAGIRKPRSVRP
jgi:hypothetical protein